MNEQAKDPLARARHHLESAKFSLTWGFADSAIDSAYFAIFHAATAMGKAQGKKFPACTGMDGRVPETRGEAKSTGRQVPNYVEEAYRLRRKAVYHHAQIPI
ncbi:MAG: hypothetical protein ACLQOO_36605 [Terriglobia bacterium]